MPEDRSWMQMRRSSNEYKAGVKEFMEKAKLHVNEEGKTRCPCVHCLNAYWFIPRIVQSHLLQRGIRKNYQTWIMHGENYPVDDIELNDDRNTNLESEEIDDMIPALHDIINAQNMGEDDNNENEIMAEQTFNEGKGKFHVDPIERQKRVAAEEAFNFICDDGEEDEVLEDYESEEKITSDEDSDLEYHMQGDPDDSD